MNNKETYQYFNEKFEQYMASGQVFYDRNGEKLVLKEDERFMQCYKPDDVIRSRFPEYWFITNYGNLVSAKNKEPLWLLKDEDNGRYSYHYSYCKEDGSSANRNVELHNLVGFVFGSQSYGKATEMLKEKGANAIGKTSADGTMTVQGHHIDGDKSNNKPDNIQFVTSPVHQMLSHSLDMDASEEEVINYMVQLLKVLEDEEDNDFTVVYTGQKYNCDTETWTETKERSITSTDRVVFSERAAKELEYIRQILFEEMSSRK